MLLIQYQILSFTTPSMHFTIQHHVHSQARTHSNPTSTSSSSFTITLLGGYNTCSTETSSLRDIVPPPPLPSPFITSPSPPVYPAAYSAGEHPVASTADQHLRLFIRHSLGSGLPSIISTGDSHSDLQPQPCAWPRDPGVSRCTTASNVAVHVVHYRAADGILIVMNTTWRNTMLCVAAGPSRAISVQ
ncbi:hypothetical protein S40293_10672 [Stachybotrys chartarum IBT 40293]|nr:hypothetical protein S40293_10672 [Stachybotrys chartarum IBT 40293]